MKTYCLYHANCPDGFASAWVVNQQRPEAVLIPVQYEQPPPEMPDCGELFIVDFSYKRPVMEQLIKKHPTLCVIDHHKTAEAELKDLQCQQIFDMAHSGCILTWQVLVGSKDPPKLLLYVEDRDLWRWKLPASKEISYAMRAYPYDIEVWNHLMYRTPIPDLIMGGKSILSYIDAEIARLVEYPTWMTIAGYRVPVCNASSFFSELAEKLVFKYGTPFAAVWCQRQDGNKTFSLRSRADFDVAEVAALLGGGGHKNAAGFQMHVEVVPDGII